MFKKKDHAMLEEAYNKVLMNEISSELPPEEEGSEESHQEGGSNRESLIAAIKGANEVGDMESLKKSVAETTFYDTDILFMSGRNQSYLIIGIIGL